METRPSVAGLFEARPSSSERQMASFETASDAVASLERTLGKQSFQWVYFDAQADPVGSIVRWDRPEGKEIRPVHRGPDGRWRIGGMPEPRPLYELPTLLARPDETVYVAEGEKAACAAGWLGLLGTTSPHGSGSAAKADWRPLAGRDVVILPDHDEAGRRYAQTVADILGRLDPPACVRIVELPGLAPRGDLFDWINAGESPDERKRTLAELVRSVPVNATRYGVTTNSVETKTPILVCFEDVVPAPVRWLWPERIAMGRLTLLVGRPGEGKSFLTTDLAARVSTGAPWPDGSEGVSGSVIFICAEDDPADTLRPRLDAHGADVRRTHLLSMVQRTSPDGRSYQAAFTLADVDALEQCLRMHPDCKLVVVDPIGSYLGNGTDAYRDSDVRLLLDPVARLAEQYGPAVLVVAHRRKNAAVGHADDLALGSRAFTGVARSVWHLTRDRKNKDRRLLLPGKNNLAAEGKGLAFTIDGDPPAICWQSEAVELTATEAIAAETANSDNHSDRTVRQEAATWLRDLLDAGPMATSDVRREAEDAGFNWRTVQRAKSDLRIRSKRDQATGPWQWHLPEAEHDRG